MKSNTYTRRRDIERALRLGRRPPGKSVTQIVAEAVDRLAALPGVTVIPGDAPGEIFGKTADRVIVDDLAAAAGAAL